MVFLACCSLKLLFSQNKGLSREHSSQVVLQQSPPTDRRPRQTPRRNPRNKNTAALWGSRATQLMSRFSKHAASDLARAHLAVPISSTLIVERRKQQSAWKAGSVLLRPITQFDCMSDKARWRETNSQVTRLHGEKRLHAYLHKFFFCHCNRSLHFGIFFFWKILHHGESIRCFFSKRINRRHFGVARLWTLILDNDPNCLFRCFRCNVRTITHPAMSPHKVTTLTRQDTLQLHGALRSLFWFGLTI